MERSLRVGLFAAGLLSAHATSAIGQRRPVLPLPSSRETSALSPADSISLVVAAARVVLAPRVSTACIVRIDASLGGAMGAAFVSEGRHAAAALPTAADSVGVLGLQLLSLRDGDTATVSLRLSGTVPPPSRAFWVNDIDYYFVRTGAGGRWSSVGQRLSAASDYVAEDGPVRRPKCLNGR